jgi:hypothetical protein
MAAVFVVALIVLFAVFVVAIAVLAKKSRGDQASIQQFQASLVKNLPQDVQADMKPGQHWRVTSVAIAVVVLPFVVYGFITTGNSRGLVFVGYGLGAVGCAVWTAALARTWLDRRNPGKVLVDLSPYPLAGVVRRSSWLGWLTSAGIIFFAFIGFSFTGFQTAGDRLLLAVWVAIVLLNLLTNLMYSDRVWLANRGLYLGGRLYTWDGFESVARTDDGRALAFRGRARWSPQLFSSTPRWTVVPVPEGLREAAEEALRQVMPAPTPTL